MQALVWEKQQQNGFLKKVTLCMEGGSSPELIAKTISKAIRSSKPKTRYLTGKFAKLLVFMRKWFGDRIFYKAVMSQVK